VSEETVRRRRWKMTKMVVEVKGTLCIFVKYPFNPSGQGLNTVIVVTLVKMGGKDYSVYVVELRFRTKAILPCFTCEIIQGEI
jgi:hypothetical protein